MLVNVTLVRDVTESVVLKVVCSSLQDAADKAYDIAGKYGDRVEGWEINEGNFSEVYIANAEMIDEAEETIPLT